MTSERHNRAADLILGRLWHTKGAVVISRAESHGAHPMLFAGAVRDAFRACSESATYSPRDFDIGIHGMPRALFDQLLQRLGGQQNRYGGYLLSDQPGEGLIETRLDVWRLEETCGLQLLGVPYTVENTLRSFILDLNAVAFDPHSAVFYDLGSQLSLQRKRVDFVDRPLIHSHTSFSARAIVLADRFGFSLTPRLQRFADSHYDEVLTAREYRKHGFSDAAAKHRSRYSSAA